MDPFFYKFKKGFCTIKVGHEKEFWHCNPCLNIFASYNVSFGARTLPPPGVITTFPKIYSGFATISLLFHWLKIIMTSIKLRHSIKKSLFYKDFLRIFLCANGAKKRIYSTQRCEMSASEQKLKWQNMHKIAVLHVVSGSSGKCASRFSQELQPCEILRESGVCVF